MAALLTRPEYGIFNGASCYPNPGQQSAYLYIVRRRGQRNHNVILSTPQRISGLTDTPAYASPSQRTSKQRLNIVGLAAGKKNKVAKLCVKKQKNVALPTFNDCTGTPQHLSVFLNQPEGRQSMLNTKALQKYEDLGDNKFRCFLPKIEFLNFEVAPVIDLLVAADEESCQVELLSCKFEGSDIVQSQNERFSASLKNHLVWSTQQGQQRLDVNLELNVFLEVYTLPFTLLPVSAVESPGTLIMQSLVDRLLPLFLDNMFNDYEAWAKAYPNGRWIDSMEEKLDRTSTVV